MRVGFLTYGLDRPLSGISRTVIELGRALAARSDVEVIFLTPYRHGPFTERATPHVYLPGARLLPGLMTLGALQIPLVARRHRLDLVHDPSGVSPFVLGRSAGRYRRVVTIHDAIPFRFPESSTWLNNGLHRSYVPRTLRHVDGIVTVSQASRDDLVRFLEVPRERVHVVPWAAGPAFHPRSDAEVQSLRRRYALRRPFVLYVGTLEPRKNVGTLLEAFAQLRQQIPEVSLVIAGRPPLRRDPLRSRFERLGIADATHFLGYVPDADLPALYSAAAAFCYPSLYEGFGLPVVEAMASGAPVVCSGDSSLPEIVGDAGLLVDPTDPPAMAKALGKILNSATFADELRRRGATRATGFSWDRTAEATCSVYRAVGEG